MTKDEAVDAIKRGKRVRHPAIEADGYFAVINGHPVYYDGSWTWPTRRSIAEMLSNFRPDDERFEIV